MNPTKNELQLREALADIEIRVVTNDGIEGCLLGEIFPEGYDTIVNFILKNYRSVADIKSALERTQDGSQSDGRDNACTELAEWLNLPKETT